MELNGEQKAKQNAATNSTQNDDEQEPNQMDRNEVNREAWKNLNEINLAKYLFDWVSEWVTGMKRIWNS